MWHHHRPSIRAYWRQQKGYGEGEAWLIPHHPDKFVGGRTMWHGRIYSPLPFVRSLSNLRIDAGVWGSAAFPSVYRPGVHPVTLLPLSPSFLGASVALIVASVSLLAAGWGAAGVLCGLAGAIGVLLPAVRAVRCALVTDARDLPSIPGRSPAVSRAIVRSVIAWLHFIQPLAREVGWYRGKFAGAEDVASHPAPVVPRHVWPTPDDCRHAVRTFLGRSTETVFWGQSWTTTEVVLTRLVKRLRGLRLSRHIAIDDGWQPERDVSVPVGIWAWLDLRALVEDHGSDRRLLRVNNRLRLTPVGILTIATTMAVVAIATVFRSQLDWRLESIVCGSVLAWCVRAVWQVTRTVSVVRHASLKAAEDVHMRPHPRA